MKRRIRYSTYPDRVFEVVKQNGVWYTIKVPEDLWDKLGWIDSNVGNGRYWYVVAANATELILEPTIGGE